MITTFGGAEAAAYAERLDQWLSASVPSDWKDHRAILDEEQERSVRRDWDATVHRGGYAGISWPTRFGGQGHGPIEECLFYEACARHEAPEGYGRIGRLLVGPTLMSHGSDEQRARLLPGILSGEEVWCQGFSEPSAGSDLANVSTTARRVENGWIVSGQKIWTSFADHAARCIVLARTGPVAARHRNLTMFMVEMDQAGIDVRPIRQISGRSEFSEVFLDEVFVADRDVLGATDDGWAVAMAVLGNERGGIEGSIKYVELSLDVAMLAACAGDESCAHVSADQVIEVETKLEALRWQVRRAVERECRTDDPATESSLAVLKLYWSELWQEISVLGMVSGCDRYRDEWRNRYLLGRPATIYSGTSEIQRNIIAQRVLRMPRG